MEYEPFEPNINQIEINPIEIEGVIVRDNNTLQEKAFVIKTGDQVEYVKEGDIVYFDSSYSSKTAIDTEGKEHYIITNSPTIIYGRQRIKQSVSDTGVSPQLPDSKNNGEGSVGTV